MRSFSPQVRLHLFYIETGQKGLRCDATPRAGLRGGGAVLEALTRHGLHGGREVGRQAAHVHRHVQGLVPAPPRAPSFSGISRGREDRGKNCLAQEVLGSKTLFLFFAAPSAMSVFLGENLL